MIASLDAELVDLLGERMKLAASLAAVRTSDEIEQEVQRMRTLATIYRAPPDLVEQVARLLFAAETPANKG
jgi:chorismate mutase